MNTKILIFIFSIGVLISCSDTQISEREKVQLLINEIVNDEHFVEYFKTAKSFLSSSNSLSIDANMFQNRVRSVTSTEVEEVISQSFSNSKEMLSQLEAIDLFSSHFREKYISIYELSPENQHMVLSSSIIHISNTLFEFENKFGKADECSAQMAADKQTCYEGSLVAAAVCGLLTPTIGGAAVCYLGVMAADIVCHNAAERNYEICKEFANPTPN
jgi:hypothetical protein